MPKSAKNPYPPDETRKKKRFTFDAPLPASFATLPVELVDISVSGAQLRHNESLPIGKEAVLSVQPPGARTPLTIRARVRWSRLSGRASNGGSVYRSGLVLTEERADVAADLVDQLVRTKKVKFDPESLEKKAEAQQRKAESKLRVRDAVHRAATGAAEQIDEVRKARLYLRNHPAEGHKWQNRARYAANRQRDSVYSLEHLAVWEFLERKVELSLVELAFKLG